MEANYFSSGQKFRDWLGANHDKATELWVGFYKKGTGRPSLTWPESVDQALCFGWIDGIRKSIDAERYVIRFTPRKPGSVWSAVNIKRAGELAEIGLMREPGLKAFEQRDEAKARQYSYERSNAGLATEYEARLRSNDEAWRFWRAQPPGYRRTASHWVVSTKREETRLRRLATLVEDCARGRRLAAITLRPRSDQPGHAGALDRQGA